MIDKMAMMTLADDSSPVNTALSLFLVTTMHLNRYLQKHIDDSVQNGRVVWCATSMAIPFLPSFFSSSLNTHA